ncbi:Tlg2-vesicle protein [Coniothyrium glycines]
MPASDYDARALALPLDDEETGDSPIWSRRSQQSFRRNNSHHSQPTWRQRAMDQYDSLSRRVMDQYNKLTPIQKVLFVVGSLVVGVFGILFLIFNESIFKNVLLPVAKKWRDIPAGWLILWALIFVVSFPPLIGYSSLLTIAGFVYGFPNGWFIAATATVAGSTASFLLSRSLLKNMVHRLIANDTRFAALSLTLKHDGLKLLVMIRMCPLPYSLSNGAVATFPTVHWASFAAATAIVSPKLMLHIFIGAQLEKIAATPDGKMDAKTKAISYLSIFIGAVAGVATGYFMYSKTKQRAAELEAEERAGIRRSSIDELENEYADDPSALEAAERLREEDDDISLRTTWDDEYRDEPPETGDAVEIGDDPFKDGDASAGEEQRGNAKK